MFKDFFLFLWFVGLAFLFVLFLWQFYLFVCLFIVFSRLAMLLGQEIQNQAKKASHFLDTYLKSSCVPAGP